MDNTHCSWALTQTPTKSTRNTIRGWQNSRSFSFRNICTLSCRAPLTSYLVPLSSCSSLFVSLFARARARVRFLSLPWLAACGSGLDFARLDNIRACGTCAIHYLGNHKEHSPTSIEYQVTFRSIYTKGMHLLPARWLLLDARPSPLMSMTRAGREMWRSFTSIG